jgi:hypothetical protein
MNKLTKVISCTSEVKITEQMRKSIPSIFPLHEACRRAEAKWMHADYKFAVAYNKYVIGEKMPLTLGEYVQIELDRVNIDPVIKQAYWKACWYNGRFYFPKREEVAAMVLRCR